MRWLKIGAICFAAFVVLAGCESEKTEDNQSDIMNEQQATDEQSGEEKSGISYKTFFDRFVAEGEAWAGDDLYITQIQADADGSLIHGDLPQTWEAAVVRCDTYEEQRDPDTRQMETVCRGPLMRYTMYLDDGEAQWQATEDPFEYYGAAVAPDRITQSPAAAEAIANQAQSYNPSESQEYTYTLEIDRFNNQPYWNIQMNCSLAGDRAGVCDMSTDYWAVSVSAVNGEVMEDM